MYLSKFQYFLTVIICTNQRVHQISANQPKTKQNSDTLGQIKLKIDDA